MLQIRPIESSEIEQTKELMKSCFDPSYHKIFFLHPKSTLIAVLEGKVIGGINIEIFTVRSKTVAYIGWLYVAKEAQGKGISRRLVEKAISYLEEELEVDEILLCIEGDNPTSFKNFANIAGFEILSLSKQIKLFGINFLKIWKKAYRFFDFGYFLWHKSNRISKVEDSLNPSFLKQLKSFLLTILFNTLLFLPIVILGKHHNLSLLIPSIILTFRTLISYISLLCLKIKPIYLSWDTAWTSSLLSILFPFYVPNPGGVYPKGAKWSMKDKRNGLFISALITVLFESVTMFLFRNYTLFLSFALPLFLLDTVFHFYPFSGFIASRLKRGLGKKYFLLYLYVFIVILLLFLI